MSNFDYDAPAELFPAKVRRRIHYRRFDTAAEAIRFAIEELPAPSLAGAYMQVEDERFVGERKFENFTKVPRIPWHGQVSRRILLFCTPIAHPVSRFPHCGPRL